VAPEESGATVVVVEGGGGGDSAPAAGGEAAGAAETVAVVEAVAAAREAGIAEGEQQQQTQQAVEQAQRDAWDARAAVDGLSSQVNDLGAAMGTQAEILGAIAARLDAIENPPAEDTARGETEAPPATDQPSRRRAWA
jgi:hypothetical protein